MLTGSNNQFENFESTFFNHNFTNAPDQKTKIRQPINEIQVLKSGFERSNLILTFYMLNISNSGSTIYFYKMSLVLLF